MNYAEINLFRLSVVQEINAGNVKELYKLLLDLSETSPIVSCKIANFPLEICFPWSIAKQGFDHLFHACLDTEFVSLSPRSFASLEKKLIQDDPTAGCIKSPGNHRDIVSNEWVVSF